MNKFDEYVKQAKKILAEIEAKEADIADLAIKVCDIRKGGKIEEKYTLQDFADATGINRSTLYRWVKVYRDVCLPLGIKKPKKEQWKNANKAWRKVTEQEGANNKNKLGSSPEMIKDFKTSYIAIENGEDSYVMNTILKDVMRMKVRINKLDLGTQDPVLLARTANIMSELTRSINEHLAKSPRRSRTG